MVKPGASELYQAQSHLYKHVMSYISCMSVKCAVQLGIPEIISNHAQPITLPQLISSLPNMPPSKTTCVHQLMRLLVHDGIFARVKVHENQEEEEEGYVLTPSSRLLLKNNTNTLLPFVTAIVDPIFVTPWHLLGDWFLGNESTPFEAAHGMGFWDYGDKNPQFNNLFNEAMASDSQLMNSAFKYCKPVFEGLSSLVDVGGGTGSIAKIIREAFPHLKCTVFDLPQVVADLPGSKNLAYVGGNMFQSIPSANAVLLKWILHDWSDEECVKILKRCKEAIPSKEEGGKVIIIEMVIDGNNNDHEFNETKLLFDMLMLVLFRGRERNEKEWEILFLDAGFSHYKITPIFGLRSLIEVFP